MRFSLVTLQDTEYFGKIFAQSLQECPIPCLLFFGNLGAGKTTLTRAIVSNLPNGENAEISSPSFVLCNRYNTKPEVHHYDLYRLENLAFSEELEESLDNPKAFTIIEWSERISQKDLPQNALFCHLGISNNTNERIVTLTANSTKTQKFLDFFSAKMQNNSF